jgi:hypothetical protein
MGLASCEVEAIMPKLLASVKIGQYKSLEFLVIMAISSSLIDYISRVVTNCQNPIAHPKHFRSYEIAGITGCCVT